MEIITTDIEGVVIMRPRIFTDPRGYFFESFSQRDFNEKVVPGVQFVQDNQSKSTYGVVRGLHYQKPPHAQAKIVRCVSGRVLDVCVDVRKGSPSFGRHVAVELSAENNLQIYIPKGFAHGFAVLSDEAVFQYKCDEFYTPGTEGGISIFDTSLGIDWRIDLSSAVISDKDRRHPTLSDMPDDFIFGKNS